MPPLLRSRSRPRARLQRFTESAGPGIFQSAIPNLQSQMVLCLPFGAARQKASGPFFTLAMFSSRGLARLAGRPASIPGAGGPARLIAGGQARLTSGGRARHTSGGQARTSAGGGRATTGRPHTPAPHPCRWPAPPPCCPPSRRPSLPQGPGRSFRPSPARVLPPMRLAQNIQPCGSKAFLSPHR